MLWLKRGRTPLRDLEQGSGSLWLFGWKVQKGSFATLYKVTVRAETGGWKLKMYWLNVDATCGRRLQGKKPIVIGFSGVLNVFAVHHGSLALRTCGQ